MFRRKNKGLKFSKNVTSTRSSVTWRENQPAEDPISYFLCDIFTDNGQLGKKL